MDDTALQDGTTAGRQPPGSGLTPVRWQLSEVTSPQLGRPVRVVVARGIPYVPDANRFQSLSIYLPVTPATLSLVGTVTTSLPDEGESSRARYLVHVHGGAWRDPALDATSIEPTVAHAFSVPDGPTPLAAIASIDYTVSPFPGSPTAPYNPVGDFHSDPAREAVHPQHVSDVLHGLALLRCYGLADQTYVLSGHSCGACIALQATLQDPRQYGLEGLADPPRPAALLGLNGLYDLPALVTGLGASHEHLREEYASLLTQAFGPDQQVWSAASPARFDPARIARQVADGTAPRLVVLDQSRQDQLVPMNQRERLMANLQAVRGLQTVEASRCTGRHAAPWEQGDMIWRNVLDVLRLLHER